MSMNISDIAVLNIKGVDYCCIIRGISKNEVIDLMQNVNLTEKSRTLKQKSVKVGKEILIFGDNGIKTKITLEMSWPSKGHRY